MVVYIPSTPHKRIPNENGDDENEFTKCNNKR